MAPSLPAPRSLLVINVSRIGDTLLVTPAVRALARAWPQARITFLGHPKRVEAVANLPYLAETKGITKSRAALRGWLRGAKWDLALVYGFDKPLVRYAQRVAQRVVAFEQGDPELDARLFRAVKRPGFQALHSAELPLLLTRALGIDDNGLRLDYCVTDAERKWAKRVLGEKVGTARPLIGLQVASFPTKAYRDWPIEQFARLGERIRQRWPSSHFLLFGGDKERSRIERLAQSFPGHVTVFAGKLRLRESAALMNEVDLYIGVDTGPTHIMGALERPMIALYHCYSPSRLLKPIGRERYYAVDHPRAEGCKPETPMAEISVDAVWEKVLEAMPAA